MTEQPPEPRNLLRLWMCVVVGGALWFSPTPEGLTDSAWHIFAVFAATIVSFLLRPLPMGVCVLIGLCVLASAQTLAPGLQEWAFKYVGEQIAQLPPELLEPKAPRPLPAVQAQYLAEYNKQLPLLSLRGALSGFADTTTWLVVAAFLIAGAMVRSGLGRRLALVLISRLGGTTLGLGYGIAAAELVLGPFVPSNTARGGGVMAPIVNALSHAMGSTADDGPERAGRYLVLVGAHTNLIVAARFLT
ncbi:MAG: SLC13 family permease, partial [Planctomycetota bacterium]